MANETKYGIISDIEGDPRVVPLAIKLLKDEGAEKLILNGDVGMTFTTLEDSQDHLARVLSAAGESGLETVVQPGGHEIFGAYMPVTKAFTARYKNLIDALEHPKLEFPDHHLVFLPGSDSNAGGEYHLGNELPLDTGTYILVNENKAVPFGSFNQFALLLQQGIAHGLLHYQNADDLRRRVTDPDKTVVVCHIPRKFENLEEAVDMAHFGEVQQDFSLDIVQYTDGEMQIRAYGSKSRGGMITKPKAIKAQTRSEVALGTVMPLNLAEEYAKAGAPVKLKRENRGNEALKKLYEELGIRKAVSGHFHESGHRANDLQGNHVKEDMFTDELFWNSGALSSGQTGILTVKGSEVKYRNINFRVYCKN